MPIEPLFPYQLAIPANALVEGSDGKIWTACSNLAYNEPNNAPSDLIVTSRVSFAPTTHPLSYGTIDAGTVANIQLLLSEFGDFWFVAPIVIPPERLTVVQVDISGAVIGNYIDTTDVNSRALGLCLGGDGNFWTIGIDVTTVKLKQITPAGVWTTFALTGYQSIFGTLVSDGTDMWAVLAGMPGFNLVKIATDGSFATAAAMPVITGFEIGPLFFGPDGNVWVSWYITNGDWGFYVYDLSGTLIDTFTYSTPPISPAAGFLPSGIATDGTDLYVCGWWYAPSVTFTSYGSSVFEVTTAGVFTETVLVPVESLGLSKPSGIIVDSSTAKDVWVSDWPGSMDPWYKLWGPSSQGWHVGTIALQ